MSWILAFAGFAALIILHELGHFAAAKAVGMRVERFSLFFGRTPLRWQRGETEYGVGWLPLGGFVKITGMNPQEEIPAEVAHRAYYRQPVWKRIVVILAGPLVNIVLAFLILLCLFWSSGDPDRAEATNRVVETTPNSPADAVLREGDRILAVDGRRGDPTDAAPPDRLAQVRGRPARRLPRRRAGRAADPARRRDHDGPRRAGLLARATSGRCSASSSTSRDRRSARSRRRA